MSIVTLNDRAVRSVTTFGSLNTGSMVFIKKLTASSSGTLSFVNGSSDVVLDSTYKEYLFTFNNIHQATDDKYLGVQFDTGTNTNYNQTITSTTFRAYHDEADSETAFEYRTGNDQAQGTAFQNLMVSSGSHNDNDSGLCLFTIGISLSLSLHLHLHLHLHVDWQW